MTPVDETRPDPDALLARVTAEQRSRARLKIFFGFAPGVGKTYTMLESAQRLKAQGVDVVVGLIESHGRRETAALIDGLELLSRRSLEYRGTTLQEFDLEAALARKPEVLLVDELAHTNAEGSRHARRWQDVLELLDAGIDVHTTLNVQHVESLNDVVAQITRVQVRETVPDSLLERADEIELIDVPPEELLERLAAGKVYLPEQALRASEHFFRRGNLLALRELALRRTAERVDADVVAYRAQHEIATTWPSGERVLVCVGPAPASARLVRSARRMAAGLRAPWFALWVDNPVTALGADDQRRLDSHLELVTTLGGEVVRVPGPRVADAILEWARAHNVTRIILGKPTHSLLRDRLRGSLVDALVRGSGDIDVHVISGDDGAEPRGESGPGAPRGPLKVGPWLLAAGAVAATTAFGFGLARAVTLPDPEMLYLVSIMIVAATLGRGPALLASALSVAAYDFFFVPPVFTFAVEDSRFILTFFTMFAVGAVISTLTSRLRQRELEARAREHQTHALFTLTRELAQASSVDELAQVAARRCAEAVSRGEVVVLLPTEGSLKARAAWPVGAKLEAHDLGVAEWVLEHLRAAGNGTDTLAGARAFCVPLGQGVGGIAVSSSGEVEREDRAAIEGFSRQVGVAFERFRLADEARVASLRARTEELRSALLSTVSHDLRTPLAVVTGAATTLRDQPLDEATKQGLVETICDEAERLERLVRNLLDMTRVQAGALVVKREWVPLDELIGSALTRSHRQLAHHEVHVDPAATFLVSVDPLLFEQVLINLLENAVKYTPAGSRIEVLARRVGQGFELEVADRGPGFDPADADRLFEKFYRGVSAAAGGAGLGLAVCRGIVQAHGGQIVALARDGGGARFVVSVPGHE
jgi:two-component system sensor histidine kinase KdpD